MDDHPIYLTWDGNLKRSRVTTFFRPLLLIPHYLWLSIYGAGAGVVLGLAWLLAIFAGQVPRGFHKFLAGYLQYLTRVTTYALLLTSQYPPFSMEDPYPAELRLPMVRVKQSRWGIFFRPLLSIPAAVWLAILGIGVYVTTVIGWFAILILGRMPEGLQSYGMKVAQYTKRVAGYQYLLTSRYPTSKGGVFIADGAVDGPTPQVAVEPPLTTV
jgi:hypothetical protein